MSGVICTVVWISEEVISGTVIIKTKLQADSGFFRMKKALCILPFRYSDFWTRNKCIVVQEHLAFVQV